METLCTKEYSSRISRHSKRLQSQFYSKLEYLGFAQMPKLTLQPWIARHSRKGNRYQSACSTMYQTHIAEPVWTTSQPQKLVPLHFLIDPPTKTDYELLAVSSKLLHMQAVQAPKDTLHSYRTPFFETTRICFIIELQTSARFEKGSISELNLMIVDFIVWRCYYLVFENHFDLRWWVPLTEP